MRTKRFFSQLLMVAVLAIMTAGTMPAGSCNHCDPAPSTYNNRFLNNVQRYSEPESLFGRIRAWLHSMFQVS